MHKIVIHTFKLERHRRYQCIITIGVCCSTVIAVLWPEMSFAAALSGVATNLIWIWE